MKIIGKGRFTGTKTLYYKILPKKVTLVSATRAKKGIVLTWTSGGNSVHGYCVYRNGKKIANISATKGVLSYTDKTLPNGQLGKYQIKTYKYVNGVCYCNYSNTISRLRLDTVSISSKSIDANTVDALHLKLSWAPAQNMNAYRVTYIVQQATNSAFSSPDQKTVKGSSSDLSCIFDANVEQTQYYRIRVKYITGNGNTVYSQWSDTVKITPASYVKKRIEYLKTVYPDGKYWCRNGIVYNHGGVSDYPCGTCNGNYYYGFCASVTTGAYPAMQCHGFASLMSDEIFGKPSGFSNVKYSKHSDLDKLKPGDFVRLYGIVHSILITDVNHTTGEVSAVECNGDGYTCQIWWVRGPRGYKLSKNFIKYQGVYSIVSRY
ncbi:MAG: hypothetical protein Q4C42_04640 [Clostridia bacterium]|nr:hypothetical protein [Clostridia bacterium]